MPIESPHLAPDAENKSKKSVSFDELLGRLWESRPNTFYFQLEGVMFKVQSTQDDENSNLIYAELGYIPFTQESALKRRVLTVIAENAASRLPNPRFNVGEDGKITLHGKVPFKRNDLPEVNFAKMVLFLRQTLPFIRLIGVVL